jgi:hypothetical protein
VDASPQRRSRVVTDSEFVKHYPQRVATQLPQEKHEGQIHCPHTKRLHNELQKRPAWLWQRRQAGIQLAHASKAEAITKAMYVHGTLEFGCDCARRKDVHFVACRKQCVRYKPRIIADTTWLWGIFTGNNSPRCLLSCHVGTRIRRVGNYTIPPTPATSKGP